MAALGLDVYGSDDEEEASLAGSGGGAGVVLVGAEYAATTLRDEAESAAALPDVASQPSGGAEAMDVDAAPGASPGGAPAGASPREEEQGEEERGVEGGLPPELARPPAGECDPKVQEKVERFLRVRREQGREIKSELRNSRGYRNPDFLQKMVDHSGIVSSGSNYPKEIFDPENLNPEDFYDALRVAWDKEQERRVAERAATGRIDFTGGSSAKQAGASAAAAAHGSMRKPVSSGDVAAVVQKARMQAAAKAAAKAKASRWDSNK